MNRIENEKRVIVCMIRIYCLKHHHQDQLCDECRQLQNYALNRLSHCRYGENKSFCNKCPTPCYQKTHKDQIRRIMAFSGPRMLFHHPIIALKHFLG